MTSFLSLQIGERSSFQSQQNALAYSSKVLLLGAKIAERKKNLFYGIDRKKKFFKSNPNSESLHDILPNDILLNDIWVNDNLQNGYCLGFLLSCQLAPSISCSA
jgi:hypothetical protein